MATTTNDTTKLAGLCAIALAGTPFAKPRTWPLAVIVIRADERPVAKLRGDFAGWLRAHDLTGPSRECLRREVPPGSVLVWIEVDAPSVAAAQFFSFDLRSALARCPGTTAPTEVPSRQGSTT